MKKTKNNPGIKKKKATTTKGLLTFFIIFFCANLFVSAVMAAESGGGSWTSMLFHNGPATDLYMDFFNSIRDAGSPNVYTARNNIYPPLCLLIFKFFGLLISEYLVDLPNANKTLLQSDQRTMMVYILFVCFCIITMTVITERFMGKLNKLNGHTTKFGTPIIFMLIISYPVMYCIERGNIIILSMILSMFFVFFRDSESKIIRELSYISLAISAAIKIYPAIFGILLLLDKKYKDAVRLVVYGLFFTIAPFVFFMDFESLSLMVHHSTPLAVSNSSVAAIFADKAHSSSSIVNILNNLLSFANKKSSLNFSSVSIQNFIFLFAPEATTLAKAVCAISEVAAAAALFAVRKKWQQVFLICYLMLNIPSASSSYALTFLIIPFIMFLYDEKGNGYSADKRDKVDRVYIAGYALLFTPLPTFWYYHSIEAQMIFRDLGITYQ